ncbi:MAG: glycosyltransferase family 1 protein [Actinobacteria bacterium]|nr:glycosyltransferase family 1 protein [Actinomycetota bacterium]
MTRTVVYLELLDPLLDADGGAARVRYRLRRDFPWVVEDGWKLERWGLWWSDHPPGGAERRRGLRLPRWFRPHHLLIPLAWLVHFVLAVRRPHTGVVVAYSPSTAVGVAAARVVGRSCGPVVVRVIDHLASKAGAVDGARLRAAVLRWVDRFVLRRADVVVPMGRFTNELVREAGVDDDRVVELTHPTRWFGTEPATASVGRHRRRLVCAGRLVPEKGFDVALRAFAEVAPEFRHVQLDIAGAGPERDRLRSLTDRLGLSDRVVFHGWLPAGTMPTLFSGAVAAVLPSRVEEGLGMVLVEAGTAGCALIGSDLGGIPELVEPGVTGLLVPPDDPEALADAFRRVLSDPEEARRFGVGARDRALAYIERREPALRILRQRWDDLLAEGDSGRAGRT